MDSDTLTQALEACFRECRLPVVCAYLFGSRARGDQRAGSDIDLAVWFNGPGRTGLQGPATALQAELERRLRHEVDVVDLRKAPVDLVHRVLRDGRLLIDRDPRERVRFGVDARNRYFDLLPHLRRYRRWPHERYRSHREETRSFG